MVKAAEEFHLQLERAYLRALRAVTVVGRTAIRIANDSRAKIEAELAAVEDTLSKSSGSDSPMHRLASQLRLSEDEVDFLWTAVAVEADPRLVPHIHGLVASEARRGLSLAAYAIVAGLRGERARLLAASLDESHPLRASGLIEATETGVGRSALGFTVAPRLIDFLRDRLADQRGAGLARVPLPERRQFDRAQQGCLRTITEGLGADVSPVVVVEGRFGSGRRTAAATVAAELARPVIALDLSRVGPSERDLSAALLAHRRECALANAIPLLAEVDDVTSSREHGETRTRLLGRAIDSMAGPVFATSRRTGVDLGLERRTLRVRWPAPSGDIRRALWRERLEDVAGDLGDELDQLAHRYRLGPGGIDRAVSTARLLASAGGRTSPSVSDLVAGIRNEIAERVGDLARRIEVRQSWDDVVLSEDLLDQLRGLVARVRHAHRVYDEWGFHSKSPRGIGVPALFSGAPGTGKTMVAGIIARELGLELLQVDLSQVVSKWIGETEKQLSRVFDAAEAGHALLLFDEADALFAKRTPDVKGATDRYANMEVNYLLQRIESFGGIVVLTTNLDTSIDQALKRRLAAHVVFWPPDDEEREELWRRMLQTGSAPVEIDALDLETLARSYPDMTGANIRNAVLSAAFLAAAEETDITQDHLERAARAEYQTMGRILR